MIVKLELKGSSWGFPCQNLNHVYFVFLILIYIFNYNLRSNPPNRLLIHAGIFIMQIERIVRKKNHDNTTKKYEIRKNKCLIIKLKKKTMDVAQYWTKLG